MSALSKRGWTRTRVDEHDRASVCDCCRRKLAGRAAYTRAGAVCKRYATVCYRCWQRCVAADASAMARAKANESENEKNNSRQEQKGNEE